MTDTQTEQVRPGSMLLAAIIDGHQITVEDIIAAEVLAGLRSLGGELLEERLGLVGRCEAGLAAVRSETVAELARRDGEAKAAEAVRDRLRQSRGSAKRDVKLAGSPVHSSPTARP